MRSVVLVMFVVTVMVRASPPEVLRPCGELLQDVSYQLHNSHPGTEMYVRGTMQATLVLPVTLGAKAWRALIAFQNKVDTLESSRPGVSLLPAEGSLQFEAQAAEEVQAGSTLSLPFTARWSGSAEPLKLKSVRLNGVQLCAMQ